MVVYTHMYRKINQIWLADITRFVHKEAKENECAYMKPLIYLFTFSDLMQSSACLQRML